MNRFENSSSVGTSFCGCAWPWSARYRSRSSPQHCGLPKMESRNCPKFLGGNLRTRRVSSLHSPSRAGSETGDTIRNSVRQLGSGEWPCRHGGRTSVDHLASWHGELRIVPRNRPKLTIVLRSHEASIIIPPGDADPGRPTDEGCSGIVRKLPGLVVWIVLDSKPSPIIEVQIEIARFRSLSAQHSTASE